MSESQYNSISSDMDIQIYDKDNTLVGFCHIVSYAAKEKIGRLSLRENISINFNETEFKILLIGLDIGKGYKYQTIHNVAFDQDQEFIKDKQITFTLDKISDWSYRKNLD